MLDRAGEFVERAGHAVEVDLPADQRLGIDGPLRKSGQVRAIDADFSLGSHLSARDERAVRKTVSGLMKILHPHGEWSHGELREYLEFAIEGRRRVKEQLKKLAFHDYAKTAFSYLEDDTGREIWVEVPEQPDEFETEPDVRPSPKPVYLSDDAEFYVRMGNSTRLYNTKDALEYIRSRW